MFVNISCSVVGATVLYLVIDVNSIGAVQHAWSGNTLEEYFSTRLRSYCIKSQSTATPDDKRQRGGEACGQGSPAQLHNQWLSLQHAQHTREMSTELLQHVGTNMRTASTCSGVGITSATRKASCAASAAGAIARVSADPPAIAPASTACASLVIGSARDRDKGQIVRCTPGCFRWTGVLAFHVEDHISPAREARQRGGAPESVRV